MNKIKDLSRREFLKISGLTAAGAAAVGIGGTSFITLSAAAKEQMQAAGNRTVYTACVMCPSECNLAVNVEEGVVSTIYGSPYAPFNSGTACAKGASGLQMVYNANRIKYPMIRVGERGEAKFKRASWDEALDYIADKLIAAKKKYGPESIIMDAGDVTDRNPYWYTFRAFGTPHTVEHGSICDTPRRHGPKLMLGGKRIEPDVMRPSLVRQPDGSLKNDYTYRNRLIVYAGWNPFTATRINYESRGTVEAKLAGAKIIVIDPAFSNTATKADQWLPIRPGTDPDLFAAVLRYILENNDDDNPFRRYIDWSFLDYSRGWEEFEAEFKSHWQQKDPVNSLDFYSLAWAAERTGIDADTIAELAHTFGITKPAAWIWGMSGIGHHYNGAIASIIGTALNVITGNMDTPGGVIDTELVKSDKGGNAKGGHFNKREVTRVINGEEITAEQENLHMDAFGDWPAGWDDVVGDYPRRFLDGVTLNYGPFRGHQYPIKAFIIRTGNPVITGSNTDKWIEALTAKDGDDYLMDLVVYIDTPFLETGMYADVVLPEASYLERMSLSDIYPSHQLLYLRDFVIDKLYESKTHYDICWALARKLKEKGDPDIKAEDFWEAYPTEEDFWNEALKKAPGRAHAGTPLPYPNLPVNYKLYGTPDSLEAGNVTIDDENKKVIGEPVTVEWLREHNGLAVWPMSWNRLQNGGVLKTDSKKIDFTWDYDLDGDRKGRYAKYNKRIEEAGTVPLGLKGLGWEKYPETFYWFEARWNPFTNPDYARYKDEYPFQVISGRIHHSMSGTQMVDWLGRLPTEDLWMPLNDKKVVDEMVIGENGPEATGRQVTIPAGTWCIGVIQMNQVDGDKLGLQTGDLVEIETPLGHKTRGKVYLVQTIRPGVVRIPFGGGGRFSPGLGKTFDFRDETPNANALVDPDNLSPIMGQPAYVDILAKVVKV
ncbi:MAG: molybdopterin-dependent oxidoreductase [Aquificales bacterium]|nr:molybdopterin-dependent oxidoreductase [Aquificales bacterium]